MTDGLYIATDQFSSCDLHFPHKEWTDDWRERANYAAIERWALHFRTHCLPKGGSPPPSEPVEPYFPPGTAVHMLVFMDTTQTFPTTRTLVRGNTTPLGAVTGGPAIAEVDGTGHITAFSVPPGIYNPGTTGGISASMNFAESGSPTGLATRTIEIELRRASDGSLFNTYVSTQTVPRDLALGVTVSAPTITLTERMVVRTYVTFGTLVAPVGSMGGGTGNAFGVDGVHA